MVGIVLNLVLFAVKVTVGILTSGVSLIADAVNNLSDAGCSVIVMLSYILAGKPADKKHPYGHARLEYIASMIVSFLILHIGLDLIADSAKKIISPEKATEFSILSVIVLSASVAVKLLLGIFNRSLGKKIGSDVMKATAADCFSDALATTGVLVATIIMKLTGFDADGYMGLVVAAIIIVAGVKILLETKDRILGGAPDEETVAAIREIVSRYPEALGIHDMFLHSYGAGKSIASLHVEVDGGTDIYKTHDIIDNIEKQISNELGIICTIHMDPIITDDERVNELREVVSNTLRELDARLSIHDFRFVEGDTHTNLIFDIAAPFELKMSDAELIAEAQGRVKNISDKYFCVICVDRG